LKDSSERLETIQNNSALAVAAQQQNAQQQSAAAGNGPAAIVVPALPVRNGFIRSRDLPVVDRFFKKGLKMFDIYNVQHQVVAAAKEAAVKEQKESAAGGAKDQD